MSLTCLDNLFQLFKATIIAPYVRFTNRSNVVIYISHTIRTTINEMVLKDNKYDLYPIIYFNFKTHSLTNISFVLVKESICIIARCLRLLN